MEQVTVAIADTDRDRRAKFECALQGELGITLLADARSNDGYNRDHKLVNRRLKPRTDMTASEDEVARIKRLRPMVLLVNMNLCSDEDHVLLLSLRRECPDVLMVLLADNTVSDDQMMQILELGAKGYLKGETVQLHLSKAIQMVGRGETWVPRKMLGNIMDRMLH